MGSNFIEKCAVTKWFWWRALTMIVLFAALSAYFFYDWQIGYPKKNYHLVQYNSFEKAREYFLEHVERERTPEQWSDFVKEQELVYFENKKIIVNSKTKETWPSLLQQYDTYSSAYLAHDKTTDTPVLWNTFLKDKQSKLAEVKASFESPLTKDNRKTLKNEVKWDEPLPNNYEKGAFDANYRLLIYRTFEEAQQLFKQHRDNGKEEWEFLTSCRNLAFDTDRSIVPSKNQEENWPDILDDYERYFTAAKEEIDTGVSIKEPYLWKEFTSQKKWSQKPPEAMKERHSVDEQLYFGIGVATLSLLAGVFALRMKKRFMAVDTEAYYTPKGEKIPYESISKIDKRKWDNKGLATLYYNLGSGMKKTRIDGMVYGQFNKSEGEPAEKLFQEIMKNFKGELIELVNEDAAEEAGHTQPEENSKEEKSSHN